MAGPDLPELGMVDPRGTPLVALLVEDNAADAELICIRLQPGPHYADASPFRIINRGTAAGACAALRYCAVDVVILDLSLPDARGLDALYRIRDVSPGTPVIVLSGSADQALALEALRAGAQDYVMKPPPEGQVLARILRYAVERQVLLRRIDLALRTSAVAARQWKLVAEVSSALATSRNAVTAIPLVANICVPEVADTFVMFLLGEEDELGATEQWHLEGDKASELRDALLVLLSASDSRDNRLLDSLRGREAADSDLWHRELRPLYVQLGLASGTAMPLCFGGRVRGVLVLAFLPARREPIPDVEFTRSVADRISLALEQNRLLRQAQQAVAARDKALSIVSHDLRSPLSTIRICTAALLDPEPASPIGIREMGELIMRSAGWMDQIVQDLLDRASLDAGHLALNRRPTSVAELFEAARLMFGAIAQEHSIELFIQQPIDPPSLDADPHRLLQALSNLVSNAIKFTPPGGRVELLADVVGDGISHVPGLSDGRGVQFTVSDTGTGISGDDLSHIFDWYWHAPGRAPGGTGLGLAIAKGLIEAHHSHLNVRSVMANGTMFWFTIAAVTDPAVHLRQ